MRMQRYQTALEGNQVQDILVSFLHHLERMEEIFLGEHFFSIGYSREGLQASKDVDESEVSLIGYEKCGDADTKSGVFLIQGNVLGDGVTARGGIWCSKIDIIWAVVGEVSETF